MLPPRSGQSKRKKKKRNSKGRLRTRQRIENPRALKKEKTKWHQSAQTRCARSATRDRPRRNLDLGRNRRKSLGKRRRNVLPLQRGPATNDCLTSLGSELRVGRNLQPSTNLTLSPFAFDEW